MVDYPDDRSIYAGRECMWSARSVVDYPDERSIYAGRECDCGVQGVW